MSDCFSREFLMQQARDSSYATDISTESAEAYIIKGVIIKRDLDMNIKILNAKKGGMFYKEITDNQYFFFAQHGFALGCIEVAMDNYRESLDKVKGIIREEMSLRKNTKALASAKIRREFLMNKINDVLKLKSKIIKSQVYE